MLNTLKNLFKSKPAKNEKHENYMNLMNTKQVYSKFSHKLIVFKDFDIEKVIGTLTENDSPVCNGCDLVDAAYDVYLGIEDMYVVFKDGRAMNLEDFSSEYGAYKEGDEFIENIKTLIADR